MDFRTFKRTRKYNNLGFTLIEVVIAAAVLFIITAPIFIAYSSFLDVITKNRWRFAAVSLAQNQIEVVRNMPYEDIGISGGYPPGKLQAEQNINYRGFPFVLKTFVRNIDDPFDGTSGSNPNDTAPADYKLVEVRVDCSGCNNFIPLIMTTTVSPKNLEVLTNNGSLFINVFDANGQSIANANVSVINNSVSPPIAINDTTNNNGVLQLVDIPTSTASYAITVTKNGYSSDRTYPLGAPSNPNPTKPNATVAQQQITSASFAIDKISSVYLKTTDEFCAYIPSIGFSIDGTKLIGTNPDILKYSNSFETAGDGTKTINSLEWDSYNFTDTDSQYDLSSYIPFFPLIVNPDTTTQIKWIMNSKNPSALLITVQNQNGDLINDASVRLTKSGFDKTIFTKRRSFSQTDWPLGNYSEQSGNIETGTAGKISLSQIGGLYPTSTEWLISNTFDLGIQDTTFYNLSWNPTSQPPETGNESLRFQIAANNDNSTWDFVGPDGASNTYYTASGTQLHSNHNNKRYLRYKIFLKTENENFSPELDDLTIGFSSDCLINGQAFINGLSSGTYAITIQKSGYQTYTDAALNILENWKEYKATLIAQ